MKKAIFSIFLLVTFSFSNTTDVSNELLNDFSDEFESEKVEVFDPLSGYNRVMTSFNDGVYTYVFNPVTQGYEKVMPEPVRLGFSNFFDNLLFPIRFVNNLLQFKFENSVEELGRFLVNSTFGILGFMDPASSELGWEKHDEDFGQTLGFYGVPAGPHIVLPLLGPSNLRDTVGLVGDGYVSPINDSSAINYKIPNDSSQTIYIGAGKYVNKNSFNLGKYENMKKDAIDLYPFLRDIYEQKREKEIRE